MPNIDAPNNGILNSENFEILIKTPNGSVNRITINDIINIIYAERVDCSSITEVANPNWSHGTNKIYTDICNLVNVGIGTANPEYKLDVRGISYARRILLGKKGSLTNALINGFDPSNSRDLIQLGIHNASTEGQAKVLFKVTHNGTVEMHNNGGHALISYNAAGNKILQLEDNGMLRARKIRIDMDNWADYVFNSDYKLMPLKELSKFIKTNHHLPNIPTANQMAKKGLNLGDMQRLQMEKIEELTLYIIDQDKKIDNLQSQLDEIKELLNK